MVNFNGNLIKAESAAIAFDNRGLNYGDAIFETMKVCNGKIYFWKDHYQRLISSMKILKMEVPFNFSSEFLAAEILKTIRTSENKNTSFRSKILVWRNSGGKYTPKTNGAEFAISVETLDNSLYVLNENNYEVELFEDYFIPSHLLSTLKTNNKITNVLGSIFAEENGFQNCFLLNEKQQTVEALNGNIFLVSGKTIKTPPLADGCLNGIMRKQLISILNESSEFNFEEASISQNAIENADEMYITNVIQGIVPITKYRNKKFGNEVAKLLVLKLNLKVKSS